MLQWRPTLQPESFKAEINVISEMIMNSKQSKSVTIKVQRAELVLQQTEKGARTAKKTARVAKLRLKEARRVSKQARKAARKAKDEFVAARKTFKKLLAKNGKANVPAKTLAPVAKARPNKASQPRVRTRSRNRITPLPFKSKLVAMAPRGPSAAPLMGA